MWIGRVFASAVLGIALSGGLATIDGDDRKMLFDFQRMENVDDWRESSDTVRQAGQSKAILSLQKTQQFQRAVFFTLLNPQPNGAGFAGVRTNTQLDFSGYREIEIDCRAQGANEHYKIVLRHKGLQNDSDVSYEQFFSVPKSEQQFSIISLDLSGFKAYFRGHEVPDAEPLDITNITMFGIQMYGGVYSPIKQKGVSSLEINTIQLHK